jgi:pyridinium-3,5-biscarboxylic acid mononucleotide sulfurtransferase
MSNGLRETGTNPEENRREALRHWLRKNRPVAIAVSGGIDSITLAMVARQSSDAEMFHAVSPAVPAEATMRVRRLAHERGWKLKTFDAGEFDNTDYRTNPVNRCFHCKTSLYSSIRQRTRSLIVSGTNLDDLADYRPGLTAAKVFGVRHPYVEIGINKSEIRSIAWNRSNKCGLSSLSPVWTALCQAL